MFFYLFRSKEFLLFKVTLLLCSKSRFIIGVNENKLNSIITGDKLLNIYLLVVVLFLLNDLPFMTNKSSKTSKLNHWALNNKYFQCFVSYSLCHSHKPMTSSCKKLWKMRSFSFTSFCFWAIKPFGYYLLSH